MSRFRIGSIALLAGAFLFCSCGSEKVLTAEGATALAQARLDGDGTTHGNITVNIGPLTSRLNVRTSDQVQQLPQTMQRLVKLGYLDQQVVRVSYPDLGGQWRGPTPMPNTPPGQQFMLQISMNRDARPPTMSGTYAQCDAGGGCFGNPDWHVSGTMTVEPPYQLTVTEPTGVLLTAIVGLQRNPNGDALVGRAVFAPGTSIAALGHPESPLNLRGTAGHGSVEQEMYIYKWAAKFPQDALMSQFDVKLGHVEVDGCDRLLLGSSDTNASGIVKWHVALKDAQKALMGTERLDGTVPAAFRKQPDGKWAIDSMEGINVRMPM